MGGFSCIDELQSRSIVPPAQDHHFSTRRVEMSILVINEIFRRIAAENTRIETEFRRLRWYQFLKKRALWGEKQLFHKRRDALQNERWLLEQRNSPDPCVLILGELYRPGNTIQESYINLWTEKGWSAR
jgi:hypothetical protein